MIQTNLSVPCVGAREEFVAAEPANAGFSLRAACQVRGESAERTRQHVKLASFLVDVGAISSVREYNIAHPYRSYRAG